MNIAHQLNKNYPPIIAFDLAREIGTVVPSGQRDHVVFIFGDNSMLKMTKDFKMSVLGVEKDQNPTPEKLIHVIDLPFDATMEIRFKQYDKTTAIPKIVQGKPLLMVAAFMTEAVVALKKIIAKASHGKA